MGVRQRSLATVSIRYGELNPNSIKLKKGDPVYQSQLLGYIGKLLKKDGSPVLIIDGEDVYMLHFEYYTGALGFNLNQSLSNCEKPFTRRSDLADPLNILQEGYENTFEKKQNRKYKWSHSEFGNLIAEKESRNSYNLCNKTKIINGVRKVFEVNNVKVIENSIKEIQDKQKGKELFAVGRYQIIPKTLKLAIVSLELDINKKLNQEMQDRIFDEYLIAKKRPKIINYLEGEGSVENAMHSAAKEWASIGVEKGKAISEGRIAEGGESYYAGDGLNKAHITPSQIKEVLIKSKKQS